MYSDGIWKYWEMDFFKQYLYSMHSDVIWNGLDLQRKKWKQSL